jgi:hypothetical protein
MNIQDYSGSCKLFYGVATQEVSIKPWSDVCGY